jgi:hypothetical protein
MLLSVEKQMLKIHKLSADSDCRVRQEIKRLQTLMAIESRGVRAVLLGLSVKKIFLLLYYILLYRILLQRLQRR